MAQKLKQANDIICSLLDVIVAIQPKNEHLQRLNVEARALMKSNPAKLHELIGTMVIKPHFAKISNCDESFVTDIKRALGDHDPLGLADIWELPSFTLEHKATIFYNLIELSKLID